MLSNQSRKVNSGRGQQALALDPLGQVGDPPIELCDRVLELLTPRIVRRRVQLPLRLRAREPARLQLPRALGIGTHDREPASLLLLLALFHPLGEAGLRIDESFSGITHAVFISD
jgi:hypothetical protein